MMSPASRGQPLVLLGAGGHAKVLLSLAWAAGWEVRGVCDPLLARQEAKQWLGVPVIGGDDALDEFGIDSIGLINGVGQIVGQQVRRDLYERLSGKGFKFPPLVHPAAFVDEAACLDDGVQVMAGAVVQPGCHIGNNSIINSRASIDHDCSIGAHVHIAPGAIVCGGVRIGQRAFIGAGATLIQGLAIGEGAVVGAGATAVRDLASNQRLLPAAGRLM